MQKLSNDDWEIIKDKYINQGCSYRTLAAEFDVSTRIIAERGKAEGWVKHTRDKKTVEKAIEKAVINIQQKEIDSSAFSSAKQLLECADLLTKRIAQAIQSEDLRPSDYRALSGALKDIRDIKDIKSERDIREQEARINKLIKDANTETEDTSRFGVFVLPSIEHLEKPNE